MKIDMHLDTFKKRIVEGYPVNPVIYCRTILHRVSRTYALTIRSLGQPFREPVLIGYLLCRIADTYEDSPALPYKEKLAALSAYRRIFTESGEDQKQADAIYSYVQKYFCIADNEEFLATYIAPVIERYRALPVDVQQIMRRTVTEMIDGMKKTVQMQHETGTIGTETEEELDQYCYYVAGTVGNMLTDLFHHYSPWVNDALYKKMKYYNADFGRALQLTNIIKDAIGDLRRGVSFIPRDIARRYNVSPDEIHLEENRDKAHRIMTRLIVKALGDLNRSMEYSILIPKAEPRVRVFCMMPVLFAVKTLAVAVQNDDLFNPETKIKISRDEVKATIRFLVINCIWDYRVVREYLSSLEEIEKKMDITVPHRFYFDESLPVVHIGDRDAHA